MTASRAPFQRLPFSELPDAPRIPHPYNDASREDVVVASAPFGRLRIRVVACGRESAPPLLLVHGLMTSSYSWRYLLEPLARDHRVIAPDLPGCGHSEASPRRRHSAAALGIFIGALQQALGIEGCSAVGNSLGGYLCMQRALREPRSFGRLAVIHAPAFPQPRLRALHLALRLPGTARALSRAVRRDPERWAHRNIHYHDETLKSLEEAREYGRPLGTRAGADSFVRYLADALDPSQLAGFAAELERRRMRRQAFPAPLLLAYARKDPMVSPAVGQRLHRAIPSAEFHWLEDSSHFAQGDTPATLAALVTEFVSAKGPSGG